MAITKDYMKKEFESFRNETANRYHTFLDKVKEYIKANGVKEGDFIKLYKDGARDCVPFPIMLPNDDNPEWNVINDVSALALDKNDNIVMFITSVDNEETENFYMRFTDVSFNLALRIIEAMI